MYGSRAGNKSTSIGSVAWASASTSAGRRRWSAASPTPNSCTDTATRVTAACDVCSSKLCWPPPHRTSRKSPCCSAQRAPICPLPDCKRCSPPTSNNYTAINKSRPRTRIETKIPTATTNPTKMVGFVSSLKARFPGPLLFAWKLVQWCFSFCCCHHPGHRGLPAAAAGACYWHPPDRPRYQGADRSQERLGLERHQRD